MTKPSVLMLGWEFPPVFNGGLGVACKGFSEALAAYAEVTMIVPKIDPDYVMEQVTLIGLNRLELKENLVKETRSLHKKVKKIVTEIPMEPYGVEEQERILVDDEEEVHQAAQEGKKIGNFFDFDSLYGGNMLTKVLEFAKHAKQLARQRQFDIIHAHDWMTFMAGVEIKFATGKPLVLHVHSLDYDRGGQKTRGWIYELEKYAMEQADIVIPVSDYTASVIRDFYEIDPEKVHTVYNGVEAVKQFKSQKHFPEKLVLFLGRITDQKGPEYFLEIARNVFSQTKEVRFVMAGTGDKLKRLIEKGAYADFGNKFHFTGFLDKKKVNELLSMADVYVMPSVSEPFGLSALEAAQFGIPCIISNQSGAAEVLKSARTADYWDTELMAEHIIQVITDEKEAHKMVKAAYKDLKRLTWDAAAKQVIQLYHNLFVYSSPEASGR